MGSSERFMTLQEAVPFSMALEEAGFKHVVATHLIDKEWRAMYRRDRPELYPVAWSIRLGDAMLPMDRLKVLIALCEEHGMEFWQGGNASSHYDEGCGCEFYVTIRKANK